MTQERADKLFNFVVGKFSDRVSSLLKLQVTQNEFDALVSFAYNVGIGNLSKSTLLEKVNKNPADPSIALEFMKWKKAGGVVLKGLVRRREAESKLYFQ